MPYVFGTTQKPKMQGVSKHDTGKNPGVAGGKKGASKPRMSSKKK